MAGIGSARRSRVRVIEEVGVPSLPGHLDNAVPAPQHEVPILVRREYAAREPTPDAHDRYALANVHARYPPFTRRLRLFTPALEPPPGNCLSKTKRLTTMRARRIRRSPHHAGSGALRAWLVAGGATSLLPFLHLVLAKLWPPHRSFRYRNRRSPSAVRFQ